MRKAIRRPGPDAPSSPHQNLLTGFQVFLLNSKTILQIPKILDLRFQHDVSIRIRHQGDNPYG